MRSAGRKHGRFGLAWLRGWFLAVALEDREHPILRPNQSQPSLRRHRRYLILGQQPRRLCRKGFRLRLRCRRLQLAPSELREEVRIWYFLSALFRPVWPAPLWGELRVVAV